MINKKQTQILPEAIYQVMEVPDDSWTKSHRLFHDFIHRDKIEKISNSLKSMMKKKDSYNDSLNREYFLISLDSNKCIQKLLKEEDISSNDISNYCAITDIMGKTFVRMLK